MPDQLCNRSSCNLFCFLLAFYFDFLQLCDIGCCAIHCHSEVQIQLSIFVGHTANQLLVVLPALAQTALKPVEGGGGQRRKRNWVTSWKRQNKNKLYELYVWIYVCIIMYVIAPSAFLSRYGADHWNQGCLRMEWLLESLAHAPQIYDIHFRPSVMDVLEWRKSLGIKKSKSPRYGRPAAVRPRSAGSCGKRAPWLCSIQRVLRNWALSDFLIGPLKLWVFGRPGFPKSKASPNAGVQCDAFGRSCWNPYFQPTAGRRWVPLAVAAVAVAAVAAAADDNDAAADAAAADDDDNLHVERERETHTHTHDICGCMCLYMGIE